MTSSARADLQRAAVAVPGLAGAADLTRPPRPLLQPAEPRAGGPRQPRAAADTAPGRQLHRTHRPRHIQHILVPPVNTERTSKCWNALCFGVE